MLDIMAGFDERNTGNRRGGGILEEEQRSKCPENPFSSGREHAERAGAIQAEADAIEKRAQVENARWKKEKERLDAALQRARG